MPPQHGKSWGSSKFMPAYIFGINPDTQMALMSYSTTFARKFNRQLQRVIDTSEYREIFPNTQLNGENVSTPSRGYLRNADEFEIVDHLGSFKAIGREGALTGNPVDVLIFDDLYKDALEGNSPIIRDNVIEMYKSVAETRLHNNSQELCVFTRWHEEDLIGWFEKNFNVVTLNSMSDIDKITDWSNTWIKLNYEALKESEPTELDPRQYGEALYPERHSKQKLELTRSRDANIFGCMFQGNPQPKEGLLYQPFKTYSQLPEIITARHSYTDTADSGDCYLCSVSYLKDRANNIYVTDIVYSQSGMEVTEPEVALMLQKNDIKKAYIESNNGGKGFARAVEKIAIKCQITWFSQKGNKESRILTNSSQVNKFIHMPIDWQRRWPTFYAHLTTYKKTFAANKYHDAEDVLTGIIEKEILSIAGQEFYVKRSN